MCMPLFMIFSAKLHVIMCVQRLYVDCMLHLQALYLAGGIELLTTTKLLDNAGLVEFTFEFLDSALNVLAFLNRDNDHSVTPPFVS